MAFWDSSSGRIIHLRDEPWEGSPGWVRRDCGCCNGIEWGGDVPMECSSCGGGGFVAFHAESRCLADYPGGPLRGSEPKRTEREER